MKRMTRRTGVGLFVPIIAAVLLVACEPTDIPDNGLTLDQENTFRQEAPTGWTSDQLEACLRDSACYEKTPTSERVVVEAEGTVDPATVDLSTSGDVHTGAVIEDRDFVGVSTASEDMDPIDTVTAFNHLPIGCMYRRATLTYRNILGARLAQFGIRKDWCYNKYSREVTYHPAAQWWHDETFLANIGGWDSQGLSNRDERHYEWHSGDIYGGHWSKLTHKWRVCPPRVYCFNVFGYDAVYSHWDGTSVVRERDVT